MPAAEQWMVAIEVAAYFGVHHEPTVAKTWERLRVLQMQPPGSVPEGNRHEAATVRSPGWTQITEWALKGLLEVPMLKVELPLAELDLQLEDVIEEDESQ